MFVINFELELHMCHFRRVFFHYNTDEGLRAETRLLDPAAAIYNK